MEIRDNPVRYPVSRLASALPAMPGRDYEGLREDIRENGQKDPMQRSLTTRYWMAVIG